MSDYQDDPFFLYDPEASDYISRAHVFSESQYEAGGRCAHEFEPDPDADEGSPATSVICGEEPGR
jgi:hypothetical protein